MADFLIQGDIQGNASGFIGALKQAEQAHQQFVQSVGGARSMAQPAEEAAAAYKQMSMQTDAVASSLKRNLMGALTGVVAGVGLMSGAFELFKSVEVAARAEEMGVALERLGKNAGLSAKQIHEQTAAIKEMGITTDVAQYTLSQFLKVNMDSSKAAKLARVAQDAAVYSMQDSSSTLQNLIYGVQTYQTEIFRTAGLNINVGRSFEQYAQSVGKSTSDLTEYERQTAVLNEVLKAGVSIQGTYEAAMTTGSKQMRSFPRYIDEIREAIGKSFLPAFDQMVGALANMTKAFQTLVSDGGALQPILSMMGKVSAAPFVALGNAVEYISKNMERFKTVIQIVGSLLAARAVAGIVKSIAAWAMYRIELSKAMLLEKAELKQSGESNAMTMRAIALRKAQAAATERLAAATGILTEETAKATVVQEVNTKATEEAAIARGTLNAEQLVLPGMAAPIVQTERTASAGLGAAAIGAGTSMLPMLGITAALAGGFLMYQGVQDQNRKEDQIANDYASSVIDRQDTPGDKIRAAQEKADELRQRVKNMPLKKLEKPVEKKNFWGTVLDWFQQGNAANAQANTGNTDIEGVRTPGVVDRGERMTAKAKKLDEQRKKIEKGIRDANKTIVDLSHQTGHSQADVRDMAGSMGFDIYSMSATDTQALKDNLTMTRENTIAAQKFAQAWGEAGNAERTAMERSAGLTKSMKELTDSTYSVQTASRDAMDALASQDKAFKDASKTGGNTLKQYQEHWAEHNQSIASSFISASEAMRNAGTSVSDYLSWAAKFRDMAVEQARAQGQTNDQLDRYKNLLNNLTAMNISQMDSSQVAMALRSAAADSLKITSGPAVDALVKKLKRDQQIDVILYPKVDWSKMSAGDRFQILTDAIHSGHPIDLKMFVNIIDAQSTNRHGEQMIQWINQLNSADADLRKKARNKVRLWYEMAVTASVDPAVVRVAQFLAAAGFGSVDESMLHPLGNAPSHAYGVSNRQVDALLRNRDFLNQIVADQAAAARDSANTPVGTPSTVPDSGGGGGKTAEELAREARRMQTAMQTISSIAVPPAAQLVFDTFDKLEDREKIASDLKSWKTDYTNTIASIAVSSGEQTARIAASWGQTGEQLKNIASWLGNLSNSMRSFSSVTNTNFLTSGRAGNKIEEWVDGLIELKNRGLNPMLLRQLMEAGPESIGAIRRLLRSGSALWQANAQYDRISNQISRLAGDPLLGQGLGADLATGVATGIVNESNGVLQAARDFTYQLVDEMKRAMGIASPSKVTAREVGEPMAQGIVHALNRSLPSGVGSALQSGVDAVDTALSASPTGNGTTIENHFHVAGFVVDRKSVEAMIEAQDWAMRTSGGR